MRPPKVIYLQWYGDDELAPSKIHEDITWCSEKVHSKDVEYVRKNSELQRLERWIREELPIAWGDSGTKVKWEILGKIQEMKGL